VISNHEDLRSFVEWHGLPFHYVAMPNLDKPYDEKLGKAAAFAKIASLFDQCQGETLVLARFMQILPPELCRRYARTRDQYHHSFLPSFAGANLTIRHLSGE